MSVSQIVGIVLEVLVAGIVGVLLDRALGTAALVGWLAACLIGLGWLHWGEIKPLFYRSKPQAVRINPPELEPTKPPQLSSKPMPKPKMDVPRHVYDLGGNRKNNFEEFIKRQDQKQPVKVACDNDAESSCLAAAEFLLAISEAGWDIDSNQVFRMRELIPKAGVTLAWNDPTTAQHEDLRPYQGFWHQMSPTELIFYRAFKGLSIPAYGTNDSSLPEGTIGIYFGPEP